MDQNSDSNFAALEVLKKSNALPEYLKEYTPEQEAFTKMASTLYADREFREYPIDNKENTFLSALHFFTKGDRQNKALESTLKQASEFHGIADDVKQALKVLINYTEGDVRKYASESLEEPAAAFAYMTKCAGFFPIDTPANIESSSNALAEAKWKLPANIYVHAARNIVSAYDKLNVEEKKYAHVNDTVAKDGKLWVIDGEKMVELLSNRLEKTANQKYQLIKDYIQADALNEQDCLMECQDLIYNVDRETDRLDKQYYKEAALKSIGEEWVANPYTDVNSELSMDEAVDFCKHNVKIAHAFVPVDEVKRLKERIIAYTNNKTASQNFFDIIESDEKDAIKLSEQIANNDSITEDYLNNVLHVISKS